MRCRQRAELRWRAGENNDTREEQKEQDNESDSDTQHTPSTSRLRQDNTQDGPASRVAHAHTTIEMDSMPNTHTCTHPSAPKQICEANEIQE